MAVTLWSFLLLKNGSFTKYPQRRYDRFLRREDGLGYDVGTAARFIDVALILEDRRPVQAIRFWYPRYLLSDDGRVNKEHQEQGMTDAVDAACGTIGELETDVVSIAPYVARNRYKAEHTWKLSAEQLNAAANAINAAAKREIVTHDQVQLLWIDHGFRP